MRRFCKCFRVALASAVFLAFWFGGAVYATENQGVKKCSECHEAEVKVWKGTAHSSSYKSVHKKKKAKAISKAAGGGKSMKKNKTCQTCHYTLVAKRAGKAPKPKAGPSCESCHGGSSEWLAIHNEAKVDIKKRHASAKKAGMIWSFMHFDIAQNCMLCHGLADPRLKADELAAMLDAGHPINPDFELVRYSQGTVRHRFDPPDTSKNAAMTSAQLARLFVTGQAAKLVSATKAIGKSDHAKYVDAQKKRVASASKALALVKSVPEVKKLLASPTEANARAVVAAIKAKDLSGEVGKALPKKGSYK
jgi:hypothetical protein